MKTKDCSKANNDECSLDIDEKVMGRRELLNKAGWYALSAATMMVLLKSQPARAASSLPALPTPAPSGQTWVRTTRS